MKLKKKFVAIALTLCMAFGLFTAVYHGVTTDASSGGRQIYNLLTKTYGFNGAQASGIVANIYYESGFNPNAGGVCYGLVQWTGSRKSAMRRYAAKLGYSGSSIKGQVAYLVHELKTSERAAYNRIKSASNTSSGAYTSGYAFCYYFERPANKVYRSRQRGNKARSYFSSFGGASTKSSTKKVAKVSRKTSASSKTYKAGTYRLNLTMTVRTGASISSSVAGSLAKGMKVKVKSVKNGKWGKISYKGKTRYISLKYSTRI